jgi:hypothetical protein
MDAFEKWWGETGCCRFLPPNAELFPALVKEAARAAFEAGRAEGLDLLEKVAGEEHRAKRLLREYLAAGKICAGAVMERTKLRDRRPDLISAMELFLPGHRDHD